MSIKHACAKGLEYSGLSWFNYIRDGVFFRIVGWYLTSESLFIVSVQWRKNYFLLYAGTAKGTTKQILV